MTISLLRSSGAESDYTASMTLALDATGADAIFVCVGSFAAPNAITSVTYNGIAMACVSNTDTGRTVAIYALTGPPSGTHDISISLSATSRVMLLASAWSGVNQTTPSGASNGTGFGLTSSPRSTSITTTAGQVALDVMLFTGTPGLPVVAPGAGQTQVGSLVFNETLLNAIASSYKENASSMGWSWTHGMDYVYQTVVAINPAPDTASFDGPNIADQSGTVGTALTALDVSGKFSGTSLTFSTQGTWPAGIALSSAGVISGTPTTAGTYASLKVRATDASSNTADSNSFTFTISDPSALTTSPLKNNTGTLLASESAATAFVYNVTTGALVVKLTGQTTNGSGVMTLTDASLVSGTTYRVVIALASGAEGMDKITAS